MWSVHGKYLSNAKKGGGGRVKGRGQKKAPTKKTNKLQDKKKKQKNDKKKTKKKADKNKSQRSSPILVTLLLYPDVFMLPKLPNTELGSQLGSSFLPPRGCQRITGDDMLQNTTLRG